MTSQVQFDFPFRRPVIETGHQAFQVGIHQDPAFCLIEADPGLMETVPRLFGHDLISSSVVVRAVPNGFRTGKHCAIRSGDRQAPMRLGTDWRTG